jgi:hypothetical protein
VSGSQAISGTDVAGWGSTIVDNLELRAVFCRGLLGLEVMTTGSGPFDESRFDAALTRCGIIVCCLDDEESKALVVGRHGWDAAELEMAIDARAGSELRVYSQEMVLASLALGVDVFDVFDEEALATLGDGHPALRYLADGCDFDWPTTEVVPRRDQLSVDFSNGEWPETGVLRQLGYVVGRKGLSEAKRRQVLDRVYRIVLQPTSTAAAGYIAQWGEPRTWRRLEKMANCLASFAQTKKRDTRRDYGEAIADWEADLDYLRGKYYTSRCTFTWPDTSIAGR